MTEDLTPDPNDPAAADAPPEPPEPSTGDDAGDAGEGEKVTVFLVGTSHKGKDGDRRQVEADRAEELVRSGLARYPASRVEDPPRPAVWG